jgi:hypothetical protein
MVGSANVCENRGPGAAQHGTKSRLVICSSIFRRLFTYFLFRQCICDKRRRVIGSARIANVGIGRPFPSQTRECGDEQGAYR